MALRHSRGASPRTVIQELEDDISRIDEGIKTLQMKKFFTPSWSFIRHILKEPLHHGATLDRLVEERQLLSQELYAHTAARFVLERFPFEIWELVFMYAVPGYFCRSDDPFEYLGSSGGLDSGLGSNPSAREAPLSLARVNRQWRAWVHSMPGLWTRLAIQSPRHAERMDLVLEGVKGWLRHANRRPLTLSIKIVRQRQREAEECGLMEFICGLAGRWRHLKLDIDCAEAMCRILGREMKELVTLKYVRWNSGDGGYGGWVLRVSMENAPNLRDFRCAERLWNPQVLEVPWANLTRLISAYRASVDEVLRLLKAVPRLKSCVLYVGDGLDKDARTIRVIGDVHLSSLKDLELHSTAPEQIGLVLVRLLVPELRTLRLFGEHNPPTWDWPKEAVYLLVERQVAMSNGSMKLSKLALKGTMGLTLSEEVIREVQANIRSLRLIDARNAVVGIRAREHVYFPEAKEDVESWHGLRVIR